MRTMPTTARRPRRLPKPDRMRALELLASCEGGCAEGILRAHGFATADIVELVRAGLATATTAHVVVRSRKLEVARVTSAPGCGEFPNSAGGMSVRGRFQ